MEAHEYTVLMKIMKVRKNLSSLKEQC